MALYKSLPEDIEEVDVIIAGGGTAGCVVAARLLDADPSMSVLVIESGPDNDSPTVSIPAMLITHLMPDSKTTTVYVAKEAPEVAQRALAVKTGSVLGGGSSVNMMAYSRAQRRDWDSWGVPAWSASEMLPFLTKLETYHGEDPENVHGHDGPVDVSLGTYTSQRIDQEFIAAAEKLGWPEVPDAQDLESINTVSKMRRFISTNGKRQDSATCYLRPRLDNEEYNNLYVLVETQVVRIVIDRKSGRAIGVEIEGNPRFHPDTSENSLCMIRARKLVIASSGAYGTPLLLERSGIGDTKVLSDASIPEAVPLPGVGHGYEDHHMLAYPYLTDMVVTDTLDGLVSGRLGSMEDLIKNNNKILGWNGEQIQGKVRPTDEEVAKLGPEFQKAWDKEFRDFPDKPLMVFTVLAGFLGDPSLATGDPCLTVSAFAIYPFSRGHIHVTGSSIDDPVDFETGFFANEGQVDVKMHIWMYKKQREIIRRMPMYRGEIAKCHPPFANDSDAALVVLQEPLPLDTPDIKYSPDDDVVLEKWVRGNVNTAWHPLGTCKMLPRDQNGVVGASLGVYGVPGLKIADLSVLPKNVAANTHHTALAVGEKAADIFIRELQLGTD